MMELWLSDEGLEGLERRNGQLRTIQNDWIQNHYQPSQANVNIIIQLALRAESVELNERVNEGTAGTKQYLIANVLYE